jgi:integrase
VTFKGNKREAERHLAELLRSAGRGEFIERSRLTVAQWLDEWLAKAIAPPAKRASTHRVYQQVIEKRLKPAIGSIRLQELKASDVKRYYVEQTALSGATLQQHHAIISGALKAAVLEGLVTRNIAALVVGKPSAKRDHARLAANVWEPEEARASLAAARADSPQAAALYALALDSGSRKNELCGLRWSDLDLERGTVTFLRQLTKTGRQPEFGPVKTGNPGTVDLSAETVEFLKAHRRDQAELKMRNRLTYHDLGLVFVKTWGDLHGREDSLGLPLQSNTIGQRQFARLIKVANVRRITFQGLRHTSATLALKACVPPQVVQARLGHADITVTLGTYSHCLPSMQQDAAQRLGALLHGNR